MSRWQIEIVEGREGAVTLDTLFDGTEIQKYVTSFSWSHSVANPYSQATVSALVPLRDIVELEFGYYDDTRSVLVLHASGYLRISELTGNGAIERFYGPITALSAGFKVDKARGTRQTVPLTFTASTWLMPLMRGFVVSAKDDIDIGTSVIPYSKWQKIAEAVFASADAGGLTASLNTAWVGLGSPLVGGTVLGGADYTKARNSAGHTIRRSVDVYGRNLSQLQPPPATGTLWGVLQNTYQSSPLVELFPVHLYDAFKGETTRHLVYRLRPFTPRIDDNHTQYLEGLGVEGQRLSAITFLQEQQISNKGPYETPYVVSYDLSYDDARNNYTEVTSPYTGATQLAGLSCDPLYHKGDIEAYGLFKVSIPYPYIRSDEDSKIRAEMNELTKYAALVYSFNHKYASGRLTTKYVDGITLSHGDWVQWRSYGAEAHFYVGYISKMTHSFTVDGRGVLEGSSVYTLERTEAIVTGGTA